MVNSCSAVGCNNKNTKGCNLTFHRFPLNNRELLKLWLYQLKRGNWEPSKYNVLCSAHFTEDCFIVKGAQNRRTLKKDSCPTIFGVANFTQVPKKKSILKEKTNSDAEMADTTPEAATEEAEA